MYIHIHWYLKAEQKGASPGAYGEGIIYPPYASKSVTSTTYDLPPPAMQSDSQYDELAARLTCLLAAAYCKSGRV